MTNSPTEKNNDGMFVRRSSPRPASRPSIDGMRVPAHFLNDAQTARRGAQLASSAPKKDLPPTLQSRHVGDKVAAQLQHNKAATTPPTASSSKKPIDIDLTLDDEDKKGKKKRRFRISRKAARRIVIVLILLILAGAGFFAYRILVASSHIFKGNVLTAVFSNDKPLKSDSYGRTNLLVFGTSESDPGHPGAQLTDSIMMVSINQKDKTAFLASVPRDLWVKYDSPCTFGYQGKINTVYECASDSGKNEDAGEQALASKVGEAFGVDFQYTVHLNLAVLKDAVNALGGIDITIESPDPRGILDRNFDWRCNYKCYLVKYPNGPAHLDGEHAMWLAQARNDAGGYGLPRSNFDREANQRKIVIAMKDKATGIGFLANPVAVTNFIESLGSNIHSSIDASEIKTFLKVAKEIDSSNIQSISLIDQVPAILTTGRGADGSSDVEPVGGTYNYEVLKQFMKLQLQGLGQLIAENAKVDVLNASGIEGAAMTEANKLQDAGLSIGNVASAPSAKGKYLLYDLSAGKKPATLKKLENELGLSAPTATTLPSGVTSTAPFVVIVGATTSSSNQ